MQSETKNSSSRTMVLHNRLYIKSSCVPHKTMQKYMRLQSYKVHETSKQDYIKCMSANVQKRNEGIGTERQYHAISAQF